VIVSAAVIVVLDILRVDTWRDALGLGLDRIAVECGHVGGVSRVEKDILSVSILIVAFRGGEVVLWWWWVG
jgi:hypothetical protein